jgi:hypothetical protein
MVAAERDVPGNTAARSWASPTTTAVSQLMSGRSVRPRTIHSMTRMAMPPIRVAHAMGRRLLGKGEAEFFQIQPAHAGDDEGEHELGDVAPRVAGSPGPRGAGGPGWRRREHGEGGARLDGVMLKRSDCWGSQWSSRRGEMAGRRDGKEFVTPSMMPRMQTASQAGTKR